MGYAASPTHDMRSLLARTLLVAAGLVTGVLLVEVGLRAFGVAGGGGLRGLHRVEPDAPWLYRGLAGAEARLESTGEVLYRINADGFRDVTRERARSGDAARIGVLGDSIAFGYGVEMGERFTERLEAELRRVSGRAVEVLNFGVPGYNPYNEAALFAGMLADYELDLVLVQFCVNDLNDPTLHFDAQTRLALGELPEAAFPNPATRGRVAPSRRAWLERCPLRLCGVLLRAFPPPAPETPDPATRVLSMAPRDLADPAERAWLERHYGSIAEAAAARGARFGVVVFPFEAQLGRPGDARLQREMRVLARARGWLVLDLLPAFRAAPAGGPLFLDFWHPSARGHAVAAEALAEELARTAPLAP